MKLNINTNSIKEVLVNFLIPLIALAVSGMLGIFVIIPSVKGLPLLKEDIAQKAALEDQLSKKVDNLSKLVNFKQVVDENVALVSNALVSEALVPQLLTQIDLIAQEAGLKVDKLSYSFSDPAKTTAPVAAGAPVPPPALYSSVVVNLGAVGSYNQLGAFLENLESAARLVDVSTFRYTMNEDKESSALQITVILQSPYLFVDSSAVTDDPVTLDISSKSFVDLVNKVKALKLYEVSVTKDFGDKVTESSESTSSL